LPFKKLEGRKSNKMEQKARIYCFSRSLKGPKQAKKQQNKAKSPNLLLFGSLKGPKQAKKQQNKIKSNKPPPPPQGG
jgi:hypothetical protein